MNWIYFTNPETGGTFECPDTEGVRARYEALGWVETERPVETPFVPSPINEDVSADTQWVTLWHPEVKASHEFPNNADAIAGALESGWRYPGAPEPAPAVDESEDTGHAVSRKPAKKAPAVDELKE
jgi:hypothetical protein